MEVKCDWCGKLFEYCGGIIHFNRTKKHYCSRKCQNVKHGLGRRKQQDKRYKIWCNVKKRAKQKGIYFELDINDIPKIPEYCPILGIKIKANTTHKPLDSSPSLDRINPNKGYVKDNVRIICNRANRIKADSNSKELKLILEDSIKNERV